MATRVLGRDSLALSLNCPGCARHLAAPTENHGPLFVGIPIGVVEWNVSREAQLLMRFDDEMGVNYCVRSTGAVPVKSPAWHVTRRLSEEGQQALIERLSELNSGDADRTDWMIWLRSPLTSTSTGS